ncbi:HAD family phosphatase [Leptothoe sp. LEGE 181152]|nr:HAD family phosphatase [Leptothoe sp. LEGE 181152]
MSDSVPMESTAFTFPAAIIFDMDGLMLNSEIIFHKAWQDELMHLGYGAIDEAAYLQLVGCSNDLAEQMLLQLLGTEFPVDQFRTGWMTRWEILAAQGIPIKPGLDSLLNWLDEIGLPKAVGTSSSDREAQLSLQSTGLWSRFNAIVTVDNAGVGKPEPDIFLAAARSLNIPPSRCLVLEDSNAGVQAAITAGMEVIMVPDLQTPTDYSKKHALATVSSLHEVLSYLQNIA